MEMRNTGRICKNCGKPLYAVYVDDALDGYAHAHYSECNNPEPSQNDISEMGP